MRINPVAFVDCLDVTYSPTDAPTPAVNTLLLSAGFNPAYSSAKGGDLYKSPDGRGVVKVDIRSRFVRISCSGAACAHLRSVGLWMDYLFALSTSPHCVTRLDVAVDLSVDGADLVDRMRVRHSSGFVSLGRKSISTSVILAVRPDGRETGTWYAGYGSSAKATAKVYDKSWQMLQRFQVAIPPLARVEVSARKGYGATLRDAALPDAIFWHIASPALLQAPEGIPMWKPNFDGGWQASVKEISPAEVLKRRVEDSAELQRLIDLACTFEGGTDYLRHLLNKRLTAASAPADHAQAG